MYQARRVTPRHGVKASRGEDGSPRRCCELLLMARAWRVVASDGALAALAALAVLAVLAAAEDDSALADGGGALADGGGGGALADGGGGGALADGGGALADGGGALADGGSGGALAALDALLAGPLRAGAEDLVRAASLACDVLPLEALFPSSAGALSVRAARGAARGGRGAPVVLYVGGWGNSPRDAAARALVPALRRGARRVLVLDTRPAFRRGYLAAAARVPGVARALYRLVAALRQRGVPPAAVHVVGFSLGAHAAGRAGRLVRAGLRAPLGRITALDPARPCFGAAAPAERALRRDDAAFVQVVHSSAGVLGVARAAGHADVYVNAPGARQPGCGGAGAGAAAALECDHNAAWRAFAASARDGGALRGRRCRDRRELAAGACSGDVVPLGLSCSNRTRGIFLYKSPGLT